MPVFEAGMNWHWLFEIVERGTRKDIGAAVFQLPKGQRHRRGLSGYRRMLDDYL